jgi:hypothetical protein
MHVLFLFCFPVQSRTLLHSVADDRPPDPIARCTCLKEHEEGELMIECYEGGKCNGWVHPGCCGLSDTDVDNLTDVDYICPGCVSTQQ